MQRVKVSGTVMLLFHLSRACVAHTLPHAVFGGLILRPILFLERLSPRELHIGTRELHMGCVSTRSPVSPLP